MDPLCKALHCKVMFHMRLFTLAISCADLPEQRSQFYPALDTQYTDSLAPENRLIERVCCITEHDLLKKITI